ncbi:MAG: head-tail connector protein [Gammaproteobacteria bacterium]|nr:head-tail connector protein [Gammaproteobacteria bacterium]
MRNEIVTAPAEEPIALAEAKAHVRATDTSEDALITSLIIAAREYVEAYILRKLVTQRWRVYYNDFYELVLFDLTPVSSVLSVKYIDADGVLTTLAADQYKLLKSAPANVIAAYGVTFPSPRNEAEAVYVEVECGYGGAAAVPVAIKQAMLLFIGHHYEDREAETPAAVNALLSPYRVVTF